MTTTVGAENETKWYDAWIRWEPGSKETYNSEDEDEENGPPIPTDTYSFSYGDSISIELQGFPVESEAIWSSTGLTIWRSSEYLCAYLMENQESLFFQRDQRSRILELGSGLGRSGILAHLLAPKTSKVFLTDGDTDTLSQLRANVQSNILQLNGSNDNISCHQLIWGRSMAQAFSDRHGGTFGVITGSDLVYVPNVIQPLFETVQTLLSKNNGIFVMAHCARRQGNEVKLEMILDAARQAGLTYNLLKEDDDIYLYTFEWAKE